MTNKLILGVPKKVRVSSIPNYIIPGCLYEISGGLHETKIVCPPVPMEFHKGEEASSPNGHTLSSIWFIHEGVWWVMLFQDPDTIATITLLKEPQ